METKSVTERLRKLQIPDHKRSLMHVVFTTIIGYTSVIVAVVYFNTFPWLSFLLYPIIFVFLCRSFVILHDAGHFALFRNRFANSVAGNIMGFLNMIPNELWSHIHNMHHATVGDLKKRNLNPELWTWTTDEYIQARPFKRIVYRFARSGFARLVLTPIGLFVVARLPLPQLPLKGKISALVYDLLYGLIIYLSIRYNFWLSLIVGYAIPLLIFNVFATVIFYLQHQFEDTFWSEHENWNFYDAALQGSSFLKFGKVFNWITGSVGYHHIHHLNSKIPFYRLQGAHEVVSDDISFKEVYFYHIFRHLHGKIWDNKTKRLIHYSELDGR